MFVFLFANKSLLISCYFVPVLSINTLALEEICYENFKFKTSLKDINMTNPGMGNK